jgi:hypothetical protein
LALVAVFLIATAAAAVVLVAVEGESDVEADAPRRAQPWPRCENVTLGYSIAYPRGWHHDRNCAFFNPEPFSVPENSDFYGAALEVQVAQDSWENIVRGLTDARFARTVARSELRERATRGACRSRVDRRRALRARVRPLRVRGRRAGTPAGDRAGNAPAGRRVGRAQGGRRPGRPHASDLLSEHWQRGLGTLGSDPGHGCYDVGATRSVQPRGQTPDLSAGAHAPLVDERSVTLAGGLSFSAEVAQELVECEKRRSRLQPGGRAIATPSPVGGMRTDSRADGIQHEVAGELAEMRLAGNDRCSIAALEEVPFPAMATIEALRVSPVQSLHSTAEVRLGRLYEEM